MGGGVKNTLLFLKVLHFILFLAVLGVHCCSRALSSCSMQRFFSTWGVQASHCGGIFCERAYGLCCSTARGVFPGQESNLRPLRWQADSSPLGPHWGPAREHTYSGPDLEFLAVTATLYTRCSGLRTSMSGPYLGTEYSPGF